MTNARSILLLAGSSEARQLAGRLTAQGFDVRALKTEPPRGPTPLPVPYDLIETPDVETFRAAMAKVDVVVDASHGFDKAMTDVGKRAAESERVPFACFQRPSWDIAEHPNWLRAPTVRAAMDMIAPDARVFSAAGWASLADCETFSGAKLMLRQTTRHDRAPPFDFVELVFGDPPFSVADEIALFSELSVDALVCRNLGGAASRPKLEAAKALNLKVILIDRPAMPRDALVFHDIDQMLAWAVSQ